MRLHDLCEIKTNFPDADFWLLRKGSLSTVGTPTRGYSPEHIGIRVTATDRLDSNYLFYFMMHLHSAGEFKRLATGSLQLVNITTKQVRDIPVGD